MWSSVDVKCMNVKGVVTSYASKYALAHSNWMANKQLTIINGMYSHASSTMASRPSAGMA